MFRFLWNASTLQLLGVIILPLALLVLIFAFGSTLLHQRAMRALVGERDEIAVRVVAGALDEVISHRLTMLKDWVALAQEGRSENLVISESAFPTSSFDAGFVLLTSDGERLTPANRADFWPGLSERESFINQIEPSGVTQVIDLDSVPILLFGATSQDRAVLGIGAITIDALSDEIINLPLSPDRDIRISIISDDKGILFQAGTPRGGDEMLDGSILEHQFIAESGVFYERRQNLEFIISYSHVSSLDWIVVMEEPWEAVISPILESTRIAPLALVPLLLITLAGLWFATRQIVQPLKALEAQSESLAKGDFSDIGDPVGGIKEIRSLQSKLQIMAQEVQSAQQSMKDYIGAITDAQEEERRRLARELHDDTLQSIIALKQRVQIAQHSAEDDTTKRSLAELRSIAEQTIEDLRRTTRALRPIYLEDLGLVTALDMLARETEGNTHLDVQFNQSGRQRRLKPSVELALYRMAQEALNNVSRHAGASQAELNIHFGDQQVVVEVTDYSVGFFPPPSPAEFASLGHFGLLGMHERADLIGAELEIISKPGKGTKIKVSVELSGE
ncbi:MAG: histidine kinase [Brevefilum sp.]|nr:histidine kinase [Brevefilum sp.]